MQNAYLNNLISRLRKIRNLTIQPKHRAALTVLAARLKTHRERKVT